jgi:hypothetical protein
MKQKAATDEVRTREEMNPRLLESRALDHSATVATQSKGFTYIQFPRDMVHIHHRSFVRLLRRGPFPIDSIEIARRAFAFFDWTFWETMDLWISRRSAFDRLKLTPGRYTAQLSGVLG